MIAPLVESGATGAGLGTAAWAEEKLAADAATAIAAAAMIERERRIFWSPVVLNALVAHSLSERQWQVVLSFFAIIFSRGMWHRRHRSPEISQRRPAETTA